MRTKSSRDVVPLINLEINPSRRVAVVQSVSDYETADEKRAFMRAVVAGLSDLESGHEVSLRGTKARLGLK